MAQTAYPFWLGGAAASMAAACTHPLDLTKVRMQTLPPHVLGTSNPTMFLVLRTSISHYGLRGLYPGISASLLRQMTYSLVRLGSYEALKSRMTKRNGGKSPSSGQLLLLAAAAGGMGGIAGNPADILLVRMTSDPLRPPEKQFRYSNALTGLVALIKEEGLRGLARGLGTNTTRAILMNASQVGSYDLFKQSLLQHPLPLFGNFQFRDNLLLHAVASCLAGTVATTICAPVDVMKSRIMSSSNNKNPLTILTTSLRREGPRFLFKGWTPAFIRLGPNTVLMFVFLEQLKKAWRENIAT